MLPERKLIYHLQPRLFALSQRPVYPSSKPAKDWDKLEAEVKNKQEKDEKLDGDAAMNKFFSDIYSSADEDMRRAMNKSFAQSNGTVLSTNWKEVGTKKVESTMDMELKKWEY
ncbi:SGS domain [Arabidopsis suecica]|uniref:SGS domain n=1 Tax=Arabidopsis suecica TaxID=45249 RepID=A0A8T1ZVU2_ARASU|nr:SGS domain [Arabidopsis suecica]